MNPHTGDWEERLEEFYYKKINELSDTELWRFCRTVDLKSFISQLLSSYKAKVEQQIEEKCGKKGRMSGQYFAGGVMTQFEAQEDKVRDDILEIIENTKI